MGAWLKKYGDAIYSTRGGPFTNGNWGGSTHRGATVYLHVFDWPGDTLRLGGMPQKITKASVFPGGTDVAFAQTARGLDVTVPVARQNRGAIRNVRLSDIQLLEKVPPRSFLVNSGGELSGVTFQNLRQGDRVLDSSADLGLSVEGATEIRFAQ